jgi:hypothetical protein
MTLGADIPSANVLLALTPLLLLIIVFGSAPLGALAYLTFGRDRHVHDLPESADDRQRSDAAGDQVAARR